MPIVLLKTAFKLNTSPSKGTLLLPYHHEIVYFYDKKEKVTLFILSVKINCDNLLAFAEFECAMINERTQTCKSIAKQKDDFSEGRPKVYGKKQIEHALWLLKNNSYKQVEKIIGINKSTLIRAKRKLMINK